MTTYIDTHTHLNYPDFDEDRVLVIANAKKAGVKRFIVPGTDLRTTMNAITIARQFPGAVYAAGGFHPYETDHNPNMDSLEHLVTNNLIAIGECGLDYHRFGDEAALGKKDRQKRLFRAHIDLALKHNLPLIMHCRDAFEDLFSVLDSAPSMPKGVIHCFSGGLLDIRMAVKRGLYLGVDGNVTYSKHLARMVPEIPHDTLLIETDAPLLTPVPHRGTRNEPKHLIHTAAFIATQTRKTVREVAATTSKNAITLFTLPTDTGMLESL